MSENNQEQKFNTAFENFKLVKQSEIDKFEKIDNWLEKESRMYKGEIKNNKRNYVKLKRGTIVKIDFGVNPGSELCHTHFAIVLSKFDNVKQDTIVVVPLTSKPGVGRLPLNNLIKNEIINNIKKRRLQINDEDVTEIHQIINEYKKYKEFSYAYISQIRAVSKSRLIYSKNKFDIINKSRCSAEILEKIDKAIIEEMTGIKLIDIEKIESKILVS